MDKEVHQQPMKKPALLQPNARRGGRNTEAQGLTTSCASVKIFLFFRIFLLTYSAEYAIIKPS